MKELGLYIHIPFCKKKCYYCDFISYVNKEEFIESYVQALINEIKESKKNKEGYLITTIYIGGGTPSFIDCKYIENIINTIKENYFISDEAEITIEVNPGTVNKEKLERYIKSGINRISIGLQSSNNEVLKTIGRIHSFEEFLNTYTLARKVGFKNINVDLMFNLPTQTMDILNDTICKVIELKPEHISLYSLILEENTKLYDMVEKRKGTNFR